MSPTSAFVLGTGRCGSSLVHEVLARHPEVGFLSNVEDRLRLGAAAGRWNTGIYRHVPERLTRKGRLRFAPSEGYRLLAAEVSPLLVEPSRDLVAADVTPWLADRFSRFVVERAARQGCQVFSHKFTGWPRARFIHAVLPEARFIHVVRDGRAVANSLLQMPWWTGHRGPRQWSYGPLPPAHERAWRLAGEPPALLGGICWMLLMAAFEEARAAVPAEQWLDVRYEDVLDDPRAAYEQMLAFLGLDWDLQFERRLRRYGFRPDRIEAYRSDLGRETVTELEQVMGEHLERWGYAVDGAATSSQAVS